MKDDVPRSTTGTEFRAVAAFDAQVEAEDSGVLLTPEQWSSGRDNPPTGFFAPRARGSVPPPSRKPESVTQRIPMDELNQLAAACRRPVADERPRSLARTCPARRK